MLYIVIMLIRKYLHFWGNSVWIDHHFEQIRSLKPSVTLIFDFVLEKPSPTPERSLLDDFTQDSCAKPNYGFQAISNGPAREILTRYHLLDKLNTASEFGPFNFPHLFRRRLQ